MLSASLLVSVPAVVSAESAEGRKLDEMVQMLYNLHLSAPGKEQLVQAGIRGMIESLQDPYTSYMSDAEYKRFMESISRQINGMGVVLTSKPGKPVTITDVYKGSPAEKAGLQAGDVLKSINGQGITAENLSERTSGWNEGDELHVELERDGAVIERTVVVGRIDTPLVVSSKLADGIGYIRILSFGETTGEQVAEAISEFKKDGKLSSIVLDLRDNPGGFLSAAEEVAAQFIKSGVLVYTRDKDAIEASVQIQPRSNIDVFTGQLTVLVNGGTASASEVLAGSLMDHGVAEIAGSRTYGKGIIQQLYALPSNGGYLKVTVEEYLTPDKHPVQGRGIKPTLTTEGEGAQTAQALRTAGADDLTLTAGAGGVCFIQDVACGGGTLAAIERDGRIYVPLRTVAAMLGAQVGWNAATRSIELTGGVEASFVSGGEGLLLMDGVNYVDLQAFAERVPERKLTKDAEIGVWTWAVQ